MNQDRYVALNGRYLADADRLLAERDYPQASEKYWGAVATMVKVVATNRRWPHATHRHLGNAVKNLRRETGDDEYVALFRSAERLHANFYEGGLNPEFVNEFAGEAVRLVEKLRSAASGGVVQ